MNYPIINTTINTTYRSISRVEFSTQTRDQTSNQIKYALISETTVLIIILMDLVNWENLRLTLIYVLRKSFHDCSFSSWFLLFMNRLLNSTKILYIHTSSLKHLFKHLFHPEKSPHNNNNYKRIFYIPHTTTTKLLKNLIRFQT